MTNVFLVIFFGTALAIGIYWTWVLLRVEMAGRERAEPDSYDFGFGKGPKP